MEILHCRLDHFDLQQELVSAEIFLCRFLQQLEVLLDQTKIIAMGALNSRVVVLLSLVLCFQAKKVKLDIMVSKKTEMKSQQKRKTIQKCKENTYFRERTGLLSVQTIQQVYSRKDLSVSTCLLLFVHFVAPLFLESTLDLSKPCWQKSLNHHLHSVFQMV